MSDPFALFAGSGNPDFAAAVPCEVGVPLSTSVIERFPDGETSLRLEEPVRGHRVFILQAQPEIIVAATHGPCWKQHARSSVTKASERSLLRTPSPRLFTIGRSCTSLP